ncbi:type 1 glutamine amidotransferase domain-containing protein [Streptomyces calidiresistens]|uniref:Type 1 glutamine amidotransferase domain-containing protein n=1 Tax=Streptomyces calidiresistens TaxID=1485586 RepID=A0A7W3T643_9ACTN|nr:type 1 glutamine amidotransferase domain-containing protein [Streptomyces calidiresistens]MBB0231663.1 type 1 glutamine amidotransferase domain-containing protein [Streptomyces calidiresistens]
MSAPAGHRILTVLTSHGTLGTTGRPTGFHLGETVEPWHILRAAGHTVDFVSIRGGRPPMIGHDPGNGEHRAFLTDPAGGALLDRCPRIEDADPGRYRAVYCVGGHGTMWDFRGDPALQNLLRAVYEAGGVVAAICHGPAALLDVRLSSGTRLLSGRAVTAFSNEGEAARGLDTVVPFSLEDALRENGAVYSCAPDRQPHVVVSGRLITGQNPASAAGLGRRLAEALASPARP